MGESERRSETHSAFWFLLPTKKKKTSTFFRHLPSWKVCCMCPCGLKKKRKLIQKNPCVEYVTLLHFSPKTAKHFWQWPTVLKGKKFFPLGLMCSRIKFTITHSPIYVYKKKKILQKVLFVQCKRDSIWSLWEKSTSSISGLYLDPEHCSEPVPKNNLTSAQICIAPLVE